MRAAIIACVLCSSAAAAEPWETYGHLVAGDVVLLRNGLQALVSEKRDEMWTHDLRLRVVTGEEITKNSRHGGDWSQAIRQWDALGRLLPLRPAYQTPDDIVGVVRSRYLPNRYPAPAQPTEGQP